MCSTGSLDAKSVICIRCIVVIVPVCMHVDKTPEEIQALFGMEGDFSHEEYERLLNENKVRVERKRLHI